MTNIDDILSQTLNHLVWVILGLIAWAVAYWRLNAVGAEVIGEVVTLTLSVLPLGIGFVAINVSVARWNAKPGQAVTFLIVGVVALGCFGHMYLGDSKVREVLRRRKLLSLPPTHVTGRVLQLLLGSIDVLSFVALLIIGGWELIQGSATLGWILALIGVAVVVLNWRPRHRFNLLHSSYGALTAG